MQKRLLSLAMMLLLVSATMGCTTVQKWAAGGAAVGATVGGLYAAHQGSVDALCGAAIGGVAGGLAGALVGDQIAQNEYEALIQQKDQEIAQLQEKVRDLERQLGAAQQEIENLKRRIKELEDQVAKLQEELKNAGGERMELTLLSDVLFKPGKAQLSDQGRQVLNEAAAKIKALGADRKVMIEGHTDSQPIKASNWKSNWELGAARSLAVVHYLISQGVEPAKLAASTYSEYEPVASNDNADGRKQNRRAVVVITVGRPYMSKGAAK